MKQIVSLIFVITIISCSNKEKNLPEDFDFGTIQENTYKNDFFKLQITFNPDWSIQDQQQINNMVEVGKDIVAGDNKNLKSVMKTAKVNTAYLLSIFKHEVGSAVEYNPSFMAIAENTKKFPGVKKGKDYLFHVKKLLEQSQLDYKFEKEMHEKTIGSQSFDVMKTKIDYLNKEITQEYISTVDKGFSLSFIISYSNDEEKNELYSIIEEIKI